MGSIIYLEKGSPKSEHLYDNKIDTQQKIANLANSSKDTVNKVETILEYSSESQIGQLDDGAKSINEIYQSVRNRLDNKAAPRKIKNEYYQISFGVEDYKEQFSKVFDINIDNAKETNDKIKELDINLGRFWTYISKKIGTEVEDFVKKKINNLVSEIEQESPTAKKLVVVGAPLDTAQYISRVGFGYMNDKIKPYVKPMYNNFSEYIEEKIKYLEYKQRTYENFDRPIDFLCAAIKYDFRLKGQDFAELLALKRKRAPFRKKVNKIEDVKKTEYRIIIDNIFFENPQLQEELNPEVIYDKNDKLAKVKEILHNGSYVDRIAPKLKELYPEKFEPVDKKYKPQLTELSKMIDTLTEQIDNTEVKHYEIKYTGRPSNKLKEAVEIRKNETY